MRIAIIGDIHIRGLDIDRKADALSEAVNGARQRGCEKIIQVGDVFEFSNIADRSASVGSVFDVVRNSAGAGITALVGNHDEAGASQMDALVLMESWTTYRDKPAIEIYDDLAIYYVPWRSDPNMTKEDSIKWFDASKRLLVSHCEISGAMTNASYIMRGKTFALSRDWVLSLSADVVALGHIHLRQDLKLGKVWGGYVGSLVQIKRDEGLSYVPGRERDHQPQGYMIWDSDKNTVEFVDVKAPRFWTIPSEWYANVKNHIDPIDDVLVVGDKKPIDLPDGVEFIPRVNVKQKRIRVEGATSDKTPAELLDLWLDSTNTMIDKDEIHNALRVIEGDVRMPGSAIGSLDKINRIKLQNIGTHTDIDLDLSNMEGLIGISGKSGSGKTFILESPYAAMFGEYPSYRGTLTDQMTLDVIGDGLISVDFESGGLPCTAERHLRKTERTGKTDAYLYVDGEEKAGPKILSVNDACKEMVGDPELLLASVYSVQKQTGNIVDAEPTKRKAIMSKLLGADRFLVLGDAAKKRGELDKKEISQLEGSVESLKLRLGGKDDVLNEKFEIEQHVSEAERALKEYMEELTDATKRLSVLEGVQLDKTRADQDVERIEKELNQIVNRTDAVHKEIEDYKERISQRHEFELIASEKADCQHNINRERETAEAFRIKQLKLESTLRELGSKRKEISQELLREHEKQRSDLHKAMVENDQKHMRLESDYLRKKREMESRKGVLKQKADLLKTGDFSADICKTCVFTKDAFAAQDELVELFSIIEELKPSQELVDAKALAEKSRKQYESFKPEIPIEYKELFEENDVEYMVAKKQLDALIPPDSEVLTNLVTYLRSTIEPAEKELVKIDSLKPLIESLEDEIDRLGDQKKDAQERLSDARQRSLSATDNSESIIEAKLAVEAAQRYSDDSRNQLMNFRERLGAISESLAEHDRVEQSLMAKTDRLNELKKRNDRWSILEKAFSSDGVPLLITDTAIPRLQDIANELLVEYQNRWGLSMDTIKETKSGTVQDRLEIRVIDPTGERDVSKYSGGEKHIFRVIIRVALALLQAERSGRSSRVFIFDEAFDGTDDEFSRMLINVFRHLESHFTQVFIVSHKDTLLSDMPIQIQVDKVNNASIYTIIGSDDGLSAKELKQGTLY